jgi:hypothetical protein
MSTEERRQGGRRAIDRDPLEHYQGEVDKLVGRRLREALDLAGDGGCVTAVRVHDEVAFSVEEGKR